MWYYLLFFWGFFKQLMVLKNVTENFIDGSDGEFVDFLSSLKVKFDYDFLFLSRRKKVKNN